MLFRGYCRLVKSLRGPTAWYTSKYSDDKGIKRQDIESAITPPKQSPTPFIEVTKDFLQPSLFYEYMLRSNLEFYTGVPDSLLANFCSYVNDNASEQNHIIAANEGTAVAIAAGYHLATRKFPVVYLQNSGIGNIINPILSLTDPKVYSIPMLIIVGWRGEPGRKDQPQHMKTGKVMNELLTSVRLNYEVLPDYQEGAQEVIDAAVYHMETRNCPYVLLVKRQTFANYKPESQVINDHEMSRRYALEQIISTFNKNEIFVATTGFTSRELYELRLERGQDHSRDFLCVGSMGHTSGLALGISLRKPTRNVICLDGDGSLIMHLGNMATIGQHKPSNLIHILLNNEAHESVGGQETASTCIDFTNLAKASGYKNVWSAKNEEDLVYVLKQCKDAKGPNFVQVKIAIGTKQDLLRPKTSPLENKIQFMNYLKDSRVSQKVEGP